jgi:hypothetical protein
MDQKVNHTFHVWNIAYTNLYNVVDSNGFNVFSQCITYVMTINWNLTPIVNATWRFENQTPIKVSPLPLEVYGSGWC